jgi:uncharacterized membrane protein YqjE
MAIALSLLVLTVLVLVLGAIWQWRRGGSRKQAVLMFVLAAVLAANVVIWTLPGSNGVTLVSQAPE